MQKGKIILDHSCGEVQNSLCSSLGGRPVFGLAAYGLLVDGLAVMGLAVRSDVTRTILFQKKYTRSPALITSRINKTLTQNPV